MLAVSPDGPPAGGRRGADHAGASTGSASSAAARSCSRACAQMAAAHRVYERLGFAPAPGAGLVAAARRPPDRLRGRSSEWRPPCTFTVTDDGHRRRGRLRQPAGARHAPAAGLVRGGHLRRDRPDPAGRARPASAPGSSSSTSAASAVGQQVEVTASSSYVDGRLHRFTVARPATCGGKVSAPARSPGWWSTPSDSCRGCSADFACARYV